MMFSGCLLISIATRRPRATDKKNYYEPKSTQGCIRHKTHDSTGVSTTLRTHAIRRYQGVASQPRQLN